MPAHDSTGAKVSRLAARAVAPALRLDYDPPWATRPVL